MQPQPFGFPPQGLPETQPLNRSVFGFHQNSDVNLHCMDAASDISVESVSVNVYNHMESQAQSPANDSEHIPMDYNSYGPQAELGSGTRSAGSTLAEYRRRLSLPDQHSALDDPNGPPRHASDPGS